MTPDLDRAAGLGPLDSVLRHPLLVVLTTAAVAALGLLWAGLQPAQYTATTRLFLTSSAPFDGVGAAAFVNDPDRYAINQAALATSRPVLERAIRQGSLDVEADALLEAVTVTAGRGTDVLQIEATAPSRDDAAAWADAVAEAYRATQADSVRQQTSELLRLSATEGDAAVLKRAAVYGDGVGLIEPAARPESPSSPQPLRDAVLAGIVGMVLGLGLAWWRDEKGPSSPHVTGRRVDTDADPDGTADSRRSTAPWVPVAG
jgi:uncharacterized protein involved in exopolysaccharide biosynthesis